jgi:hypothetical protein
MSRMLWVAVAVLLYVWSSPARAGDPTSPDGNGCPVIVVPFDGPGASSSSDGGRFGEFKTTRKPDDPPDLTLGNFFTAGWDEEWTRRSSEDRAPDVALLKVQTNFMEREIRINYADTSNQRSKTNLNLTNLDSLIAWSFNRRFMLEVVGNYQWDEERHPPDISGASEQFVGRVQLISTPDSSYSFNFRAVSADAGLGQHFSTLSYGLAGFEDLTRFGLYRVGLYGSALFDSYPGHVETGGVRNDVQYDITIAKTLTRPDMPLIGNFTVYLETFATTNFDGDTPGHTVASVTPGIRFNLGKVQGLNIGQDNWLLFGADIPFVGPKPWDTIYRFTYIKTF